MSLQQFPWYKEQYEAVCAQVADSAKASGRKPEDVGIVAISKFQPAQAVLALAELGHRHFGENYMQEAHAKQKELHAHAPNLHILWHATGPVQSNKAKDVAGHFHLLHTLASEKLAQAICHRLPTGVVQQALIQVNIGNEPQKAGISTNDLPSLAEKLEAMPGIQVQGLMCLPPRFDDEEGSRPFFALLRQLRDQLQLRLGRPLPHLSMGMSGDFRAAVAEGATLVRIGTAFFGERS